MRNRLLSSLILFLFVQICCAQTTFDYDAAGNRVKRTPPPPDLTVTVYARPVTTYGVTNTTLVVDVVNLGTTPTSGLLTVYVAKEPHHIFTFNPGLTTLNGQAVGNSAWTFVDDNSDFIHSTFYVLTTNQVIAGEDVLSFGLNGLLNPGGSQGSLTVSASVVPNGGETILNNNADSDNISYFP